MITLSASSNPRISPFVECEILVTFRLLVMSGRYCDQPLPLYSQDDVAPGTAGEELKEYTRTWPALLLPLPSLNGAPIATRVPSDDIDTEYPDWSDAASPSMSDPN